MRDELLEECISYFKNNLGFNRLFILVWEKVKSIGKIGGNVILKDMTSYEKESIERFLRKALDGNTCTISVKELEKAFSNTRYGELDFIEVLENYFGKKFISNKEYVNKYNFEKEEFFNKIYKNFKDTIAYKWLDEVFQQKSSGYQTIIRAYESGDRRSIEISLMGVASALNNLPCIDKKYMRIGVFATEITKDPHFFDKKTLAGNLLLYGLAFLFKQDFPKNAEETSEIYYKAGLLTDSISSYSVMKNIELYLNDKPHPAFKAFCDLNEDFVVTLSNLENITDAKSYCDKVFVVENPNVFSSICDILKGQRFSMICSNGQLRLASLLVLDMLYKNFCNIYYSGDLDGNGLLIAKRLKDRYKDKFNYWHYTVEDYLENLSDIPLSKETLSKIEKIKDDDKLNTLICEMLKEKKAAYQEMMVEKLALDISNML